MKKGKVDKTTIIPKKKKTRQGNSSFSKPFKGKQRRKLKRGQG